METVLITLKSASLSLLMGGLALAGVSEARSIQDHDHGTHARGGHESAEQGYSSGDPYLLGTDAVSGKALGAIDKQVIVQHEGRELRFSGEESAATFRTDPGKYLATIDQLMIEQQLSFYPLDTCVVSGEKLGGEMGEPIDVIHKNRLVRLCCKGCKKALAKDPEVLIAKLDKAVVERQGKTYPLPNCVVSGEELGGAMGEPIDYVVGNRLVRLCCKGCKKKVAKDPLAYLAKLDGSAEHGHGTQSGGHGHGGDHHDGQ